MARPTKTGLDYFPLDVNLDDDIELLEAECGLEGYAILIKLWQKIYSSGYFIKWDDDMCLLFARKINSESTRVSSVINACLRRSIFSKKIFDQYGILTSKAIQKRFFMACKLCKRKSIIVFSELMLVNPEEMGINPEETSINSEFSTQRKGKERKEKEKKKYNEFVFLSDDEHNNLVARFGKQGTEQRITKLDNYIGSKGKKYKSHYHTILMWESKNSEDTRQESTHNYQEL